MNTSIHNNFKSFSFKQVRNTIPSSKSLSGSVKNVLFAHQYKNTPGVVDLLTVQGGSIWPSNVTLGMDLVDAYPLCVPWTKCRQHM
jgi:hypothetical protein